MGFHPFLPGLGIFQIGIAGTRDDSNVGATVGFELRRGLRIRLQRPRAQ